MTPFAFGALLVLAGFGLGVVAGIAGFLVWARRPRVRRRDRVTDVAARGTW